MPPASAAGLRALAGALRRGRGGAGLPGLPPGAPGPRTRTPVRAAASLPEPEPAEAPAPRAGTAAGAAEGKGGRGGRRTGTGGGGGGKRGPKSYAARTDRALAALGQGWKVRPREHDLQAPDEALPLPVWEVLRRLRAGGFEAYLVGGSVRDALWGEVPKDFDIVTSADLKQVKRMFREAIVVGQRVPVANFQYKGCQVEISSFQTGNAGGALPADCRGLGRVEAKERRESAGYGKQWDRVRRTNALRRDFTVNGLLYDPFQSVVYDYVGGIKDLKARKLRTVVPPVASFLADPARILRAVRFVGRTGCSLESATHHAIKSNLGLIFELPQARVMMEVNAMMGYGAAAQSFLQMWKYGLLDLLLPFHADYLRARKISKRIPINNGVALEKVEREYLFSLLRTLDRRVAPQAPVEPAVWVALLATPLVAQSRELKGSKIRKGNALLELEQEENGGLQSVVALAVANMAAPGERGGAASPAGGAAAASVVSKLSAAKAVSYLYNHTVEAVIDEKDRNTRPAQIYTSVFDPEILVDGLIAQTGKPGGPRGGKAAPAPKEPAPALRLERESGADLGVKLEGAAKASGAAKGSRAPT